MDTSTKYRKQSDSYSPKRLQDHSNFKYHLSHERFVVPWQMENDRLEKEKDK